MQKIMIKVSTISIVLSVFYLIGAFNYPFGSLAQPGPGLYPLAVGVLLLIASIGICSSTIRNPSVKSFELPQGANLARLSLMTISMIFYVVALPYIGHLLASAVVVFGTLQAMGLKPLYLNFGVTVSLSVGSFYLFDILLQVPLPRGFFFIR